MKTISKFTYQILFFLVLNSCSYNQNKFETTPNTTESYRPMFTDTFLVLKIEYAYNENDTDTLDYFFSIWNKTIPPNNSTLINQNDTIKAVYESFNAFYQPLHLLSLGRWEWGNHLNKNAKYVAVQNQIYYAIIPYENLEDEEIDYDYSKIIRDSIMDFRPPLALSHKKILYLTPEYNTTLNKFLGTESTELGDPSIMTPSRPKGESEKRYNLIRSYIPIVHGHWGGYWHLNTHPDVFAIIFNKDLTSAKFIFRVGYQGGEAIFIKKRNKWTKKYSRETWIE